MQAKPYISVQKYFEDLYVVFFAFLEKRGEEMVIYKILNNNVVVVKDENNAERIVMGKGIAYQKKAGDSFDDDKVDKVFAMISVDASRQYQELLAEMPIEYVELGEEIIFYAKTFLGKKLNETIYISLTDHIYTALVRFLDGITVKNPLLYDIHRFYPDEFQIGKHALDMVEERFKIRLPEDEAGFIALHIATAEMDENDMNKLYAVTKIVQEISNIVKYMFNIEFDEESVYYYRFITHLKFFASRLVNGKTYKEEENDELLDIIRIKYRNSYNCCKKIEKFLKEKYNYSLSDEEKLYLTIHIERVVYKTSS